MPFQVPMPYNGEALIPRPMRASLLALSALFAVCAVAAIPSVSMAQTTGPAPTPEQLTDFENDFQSQNASSYGQEKRDAQTSSNTQQNSSSTMD